MTSNELRIGNLARDKVSKTELKVVGLTENNVVSYVIDRSKFPLANGWAIEPLPLTEEWLLQFGFEKQHKELSHLSPLNLPETFNLPNSPFSYSQGKLILTTGTGDFCVYIEYVHQLQNLYFALTGEELTFKQK